MEEPVTVELLEKYINGNCTADEIALIKKWYHSFDRESDYISGISIAEEKELEKKIYNHILSNIGIPVNESEPVERAKYATLRKLYALVGVAAAIVIVFGGLYTLRHREQVEAMKLAAQASQHIECITNNSRQIYKATLPDNSFVWLQPNSQLTFPKVFDSKARVVSISGQCFFEVTKNPQCPFIINSRSIITKVWGTSFLVRDNAGSNSAEVSVLTGKVSVSIKTANFRGQSSAKLEKGEVMLYPHQKVTYLLDKHLLRPEFHTNETRLQIWKHVNLSFDNKPLGEIIPVLNSTFHVHIKTRDAQLKHYILNADLTSFNLPEVLEALKKSLNINYDIQDDNILLN